MINLFDTMKLSKQFSESKPFKHIVLDNFLKNKHANQLLNDLDNYDQNKWDKRNCRKIQVKWRSDWKQDSDVPVNTFSIIQYLNSGNFLRWLSHITGITGIIPDPYLTGGGFNKINNKGTLAIHADGNWHDLMKVHRRLNVIIYLNKNWNDDWGGQLELWSKTKDNKPNTCSKRISPLFNRMVLFQTDDFSFHGHPTPLNCPEEISRKSLILYYYTNTRPKEEVISIDNHHRALFHNPDEIGINYE